MILTLLALAAVEVNPIGDVSRFNDLFVRMLLILGGVLVVSVILLKVGLPWLAGRGARSKHGLIEVVETHRLEPRKVVYLLRVGSQYYLVGSCDGQLTTLAGESLDNDAIAAILAKRAKQQDLPSRSVSKTG